MRRELDGFVLDDSAGALTLTKVPAPAMRKLVPAALFLIVCLTGAVVSGIKLATEGEWPAMVGPQKALSVAVIVVLTTMAATFARSVYFALDRGFRVEASGEGLSIRRHHFDRLAIPRAAIAAIHVRARSLQPPRRPRTCQVRIELELHELDEALDLFAVGPTQQPVADSPEQRAHLTKLGLEIGDALAHALEVPREWTDFKS